ncbi:hypothetical protein [Nocardia noduli]|uniref:hypothetical protein n=1 Tax=Nocardia noduli TaxID=2815722 RepID=UPI001C22AF7C|nr:hypothetical protein [Nocardia noduli]
MEDSRAENPMTDDAAEESEAERTERYREIAEAEAQFALDLEKYKDFPVTEEDREKFNAPWGPC